MFDKVVQYLKCCMYASGIGGEIGGKLLSVSAL